MITPSSSVSTRPHGTRWAAVALIAATVGVAIAGCRPAPSAADVSHPTAAPGEAATIATSIPHLRVVKAILAAPGYERSCGRGKACTFGPAWSDDTTAPGSHNGCDTRNDILAAQLTNPVFKPGTHRCKVTGGILHDPYSGRAITFTPGAKSPVQIDHVFALQRAWDAGAATWTPARRAAFANDPANLLAVNSADNNAKRAQGPDTWLPPNAGYRCTYIARYLHLADIYHLAVTRADIAVAQRTCP